MGLLAATIVMMVAASPARAEANPDSAATAAVDSLPGRGANPDSLGIAHIDSLARAEEVPDSLGGTADASSALAEEGPDTLGVSFELGASTDVTTERFFEDAFLDSVALGLREVNSPESRFAAVWHATAAGTRGGRASAFRLDNELSWGDLVRQDLLSFDWRRTDPSEEWSWSVTPRGEYRHDRTFGRDLEEATAAASGRLRRSWAAQGSTAELSAQGEWFRTHGTGADFVPDRNVGGLMLRFAREPASGSEWQLGYGATARAFPDTIVRDHVEQRAEAGWRRDLDGGHRFELSGEFARRNTLHAAPTSQDRFREGELGAGAELSFGGDWGVSVRARAERLRYDERDTTVFFDYDLARLEFEPRWSDGAWTLRIGPRCEWLSSPGDPSDEYRELGGAVEVEWVGRGWWSLTPSGGWREYASELTSAPAPGTLPVSASRSSFGFGQLDVMGDQPLPGRVRFRLFASGRFERHTDREQDARSLYISLDVRRLF